MFLKENHCDDPSEVSLRERLYVYPQQDRIFLDVKLYPNVYIVVMCNTLLFLSSNPNTDHNSSSYSLDQIQSCVWLRYDI